MTEEGRESGARPGSDWPPAFSLDGPSIMTLLTGDRFYSSADAALREAVLNAIDACGRRLSEDAEYQRSITVTFDETTRTLVVVDNGDGMDRDDVAALFAKVGASASRAVKKSNGGKYEGVGEFGIGIVSYFLVCNRFEVHTFGKAGEPVGLVFRREMFDMQEQAESIVPRMQVRGTTLILHVLDDQRLNLLLQRFPHWVRDVPYLSASSSARGALQQGGRRQHSDPIPIETPPDWVEKAELGPPAELDYWRAQNGTAHIDILYRGVFVQESNIAQLWGIEGSLHVNPKRFKSKLNEPPRVSRRLG